jgi:hypothetical protein
MFYEIECQTPVQQLQERLKELNERFNKLNEESPLISGGAADRARENITDGDYDYRCDQRWDIDFQNATDSSVLVAVVNSPQQHRIEGKGLGTFSEMNVGASPTLQVRDPTTKTILFSRVLNRTAGVRDSFTWNGNVF